MGSSSNYNRNLVSKMGFRLTQVLNTWLVWASHASQSTGKYEIYFIGLLIDPDFQGKTGMLYKSEEENAWNGEDPLKYLLLCPVISQQKLQQSTVGSTTWQETMSTKVLPEQQKEHRMSNRKRKL